MSEAAAKPVVLVGSDLEAESDVAIQQAHAWAERGGARLVVCHIVRDATVVFEGLGTPVNEVAHEREAIAADRRKALQARVEKLTGSSAAEVELIVDFGAAHRRLEEHAKNVGAALLVVAGSSKDNVEKQLLGSTAEQVVLHADVPLLVARPTADAGGVVLAATDLSDASFAAIARGKREAAARGAKLVVATCLNVPTAERRGDPLLAFGPASIAAFRDAATETMHRALAEVGGEAEVQIVEGLPKKRLVELCREIGAELLVIARRGHGAMHRREIGSVALALSRNAPCSVMIDDVD